MNKTKIKKKKRIKKPFWVREREAQFGRKKRRGPQRPFILFHLSVPCWSSNTRHHLPLEPIVGPLRQ
jgi:hypothetical protein